MHVWSSLHAKPHEPQLRRLVLVSMQLPPHWVSPPLHAVTHWRCWHSCAPGHVLAQAPQFLGSDSMSMHRSPHETSWAPQPQTPLVHVCFAVHWVAQLPQWVSSPARSTQAPWQLVSPPVHMATQLPA